MCTPSTAVPQPANDTIYVSATFVSGNQAIIPLEASESISDQLGPNWTSFVILEVEDAS